MRSKLGTHCDALIEIGWLLALVVEPLYFHVFSSRVFEPDKLALLRSIATLMAVAWLTRWIDERLASRASQAHPAVRKPWERPLVGATLFFALAQLLSTALSVAPRTSLLGSYVRLQGTYTFLAYLVVFGCLLTTLRRAEQVERALTTALLSSVPVALYGLVQHYGLDPLPWGGDVVQRVASTMGNSIFVGAFLLMLVPITLSRLVRLHQSAAPASSRRERRVLAAALVLCLVLEVYAMGTLGLGRGIAIGLLLTAALGMFAVWLGRRASDYLLLGAYVFVLSAQLLCIYFSQSRGPEIGLLVGVFFFWLLYLALRRSRRLAALFLAAALGAIGLLIVLNIPASPLAGIRDLPYIGRLGRLLEIESGTGKVRVLLWEAAVEMATDTPLRAAVGYGPDATFVAFSPFYPPDLAHYESRGASGDRSHNEIFDTLVMTGVVGLAGFAWVATAIFYYGLKWLGLVSCRAQARAFWIATGGGALLGLFLPRLIDHSYRFSGVGVPVGFMVGLAIYVAIAALSARPSSIDPETSATPLVDAPLLLIALLAALAGHYAELSFGFGVAATRTYFWAFAGLLVAIGEHQLAPVLPSAKPATSSRPVSSKPNAPRQRGGQRAMSAPVPASSGLYCAVTVPAVVSGWILATLAWDFCTNPTPTATSAFAVLRRSFTTLAARGEPNTTSGGLLLIAGCTWLIGLLIHLGEGAPDQPDPRAAKWLQSLGLYALISLGIGLLFALWHAGRLVNVLNPERLLYGYYLFGLVVWLSASVALYMQSPRGTRLGQTTAIAVAVLVGALGIALIVRTNVRIIAADVLYKAGLRYDGQQAWDESISYYRQAISMAPNEDYYYLYAGRALMERAQVESAETARDAYFEASLAALQQAKRLNPLNADHTANMARMHRTWAGSSTDALQRAARLQTAEELYAQALTLAPHSAQLYNEWGLVYIEMGDLDRAMEIYQRSLALDQQYVQTYLLIGDWYLTQANYANAVEQFELAAEVEPDNIQAWSALAYALSQNWQVAEAIDANLRVLELAPQDYVTLKNLAILYREVGEHRSAIDAATRALAISSADQAALQQFIAQEQLALQDADASP